jgi:hypothetical protein
VFLSSLRKLFRKSSPHGGRPQAPRYRPRLEALEDRTVLSTGLHAVPSPIVTNSSLDGTAILSSTDIWAVGSVYNATTFNQPFAEHFNGTSWSVVPTAPLPSGSVGTLNGVAAVASNNVWAVGTGSGPFIEHFDGKSWSLFPSPSFSRGWLNGVTAFAANDVWAAGSTGGGNLIEHFDGTAWSVVAAPNPQRASGIFGISGTSSTDVWAVGLGGKYASGEALHWNGQAWSIVPVPQPFFQGSLRSVSAIAPNNVWAVGQGQLRTGGSGVQTLIEHWDGTSWTIVASPNVAPSLTTNELIGVAAVSANDIWAVGESSNSSTGTQTLVEHWDGTSWTIVSSPTGAGGSHLEAVAATSTGIVVAVGMTVDSNGNGSSLIAQP